MKPLASDWLADNSGIICASANKNMFTLRTGTEFRKLETSMGKKQPPTGVSVAAVFQKKKKIKEQHWPANTFQKIKVSDNEEFDIASRVNVPYIYSFLFGYIYILCWFGLLSLYMSVCFVDKLVIVLSVLSVQECFVLDGRWRAWRPKRLVAVCTRRLYADSKRTE